MPRTGRPSIFTEELAEEILTRTADGETLVSICKDLNVSVGTINGWVLFPSQEAAAYNFSERIARARQLQRQAWAEIAANTAFNTELGKKTVTRTGGKFEGTEETECDMVEHRKLKVQTLQWFLARLDRNIYGDGHSKLGEQDEPGTIKVKIVNDPEA